MTTDHYDVVIVGGAFSGATASLLLRRWVPDCRVLIVEESEAFGFKVGEATVEISSFFLHRVLGLHDLLAREHLSKHGLRYWFAKPSGSRLEDMSEVGPAEVPRVPAFQLDRSRLDQSLLELAASEGAEVMRPARVESVDLGWPQSTIEVSSAAGSRTVTCRWVLDASGRHAFLSRRLRLRRRIEEHPTAAVWCRWRGVADFDGPAVLGADPRHPRLTPIAPARRLATNHFCGRGYWTWMIPLRGGETSIGVVYDKRLFEFAGGVPAREGFEDFIRSHSGIRELVEDASIVEGDLNSYSHLPYTTDRYMDRGWALLGDAATFIDPFYSPGLDHASISVYSTVRLLRQDLEGELDDQGLGAAAEQHNDLFKRSIERWVSAIYLDKYELMGDAELTGAAFLLDTSLYYMGIVTPIHQDIENLRVPVFGENILPTRIAYGFIRFYSRRLVSLARRRLARGDYGRRNEGMRRLLPTAGIGPAGSLAMLRGGLRLWLGAEVSNLLPVFRRSAGASSSTTSSAPSPPAPAPSASASPAPAE
ncbi:MAG: tryptophan 7-halogenase [Thermoanaerobaculia bacterium]|nr:tryptophan 7-halogenase [Thermoanaerobaculia bacterium]